MPECAAEFEVVPVRRVEEVESVPVTLSFRQALVSPCVSCSGTPCCSYLPLKTFRLATLTDVDEALYLLNFDNIELGVVPDGTWSVYYRQTCRFNDQTSGACTLHGTSAKPHVCVQYNPYTCFYRGALSEAGSSSYLRIDRTRMRTLADALVFDDERRVVGAPSIDWLVEQFADVPLAASLAAPLTEELAEVPDTSGVAVDRPCEGCGAYCCTALLFSVSPPMNLSALDYLRFALGFPGTEVVVTDSDWHLAVRTRCRHLEDQRCGVFGTEERPLRCGFYDEWVCGYRPVFFGRGAPLTARIRLEEFPALLTACVFNLDGSAAVIPTADELRAALDLAPLQPQRVAQQ